MEVMSESRHPIRIGCSGWSYPEWEGPFYPPGMAPGEYLEFYADRFPVVEVDSTFYRAPTPRMVRGWRDRTPEGFRFAPKVPKVITHEKQLRDCGEEVDGFVSSIAPLGPKLACALLQLGYFNRQAFASLDDFLAVLDPFLAAWPHRTVPLALEVRNPRWVGEELLTLLRSHGTAFTLTEQKWMPRPARVVESLDPVTGPLAFVRLLGDREAIEKLTQTWDRVVIDRANDLVETAVVLKDLARRVPVYAFVNNHYAGFAPATVRELRRLLGQPEPSPPERPRTTLFD